MKTVNVFKGAAKVLLALGLVLAMGSFALAKTQIVIEYPYPDLFDKVHGDIIKQFKAVEPDIEVKVRTKYQSYEDGTKKVLRASMTNSLPDVTFQGISQVRVLVDKGIAQPMNGFIEKEKNFGEQGFYDAMFQTCKFNGNVYGLPFAVSQPIAFYNMDLARKAGYTEETLPKTWDEVYAFARKVEAGSEANGFFYHWGETGFWQLQALLFAEGGRFMDAAEKHVTLDGPKGQAAFDRLREMVKKGNMRKDYNWTSSKTDYYSGKLGLLIATSSILYNARESVDGRFEIKTGFFPGLHDGSKLPVGGNAAVMVTKDPEKQKAVWKFMKFWCGIEGAKVVATKTGYMAPNKNAVAALQSAFDKNPNAMTVYRHQPYMTGWYAFPGKNGLKITEMIYGAMEKVVTTDADTKAVVADLNRKIQRLVP
jgi:multiple sugar transport system substrate-binding protein